MGLAGGSLQRTRTTNLIHKATGNGDVKMEAARTHKHTETTK